MIQVTAEWGLHIQLRSWGVDDENCSGLNLLLSLDGFGESAGEVSEKIVFILECHRDDSQVGSEPSGLLRKVL